MRTTRVLLLSTLAASVAALVPHKYWNRPVARQAQHTRNNHKLCMYFDDPERLDDDTTLESSIYNANWIMSYQEEKRLALQNILGYQPQAAAQLTEETVEEETLRWAIDTNIVWVEDEEDVAENDEIEGDATHRRAKYDSIQDVRIASSTSILESLAFTWSVIENFLQEQETNPSTNAAQLLVFPKSTSLWDYDAMVNMLVAIQISKPLLEHNLQLDLFHPHYKHSPRMWSPEMHAPFPTLGISLQNKPAAPVEEMDMDATRAKLDKLFQSMDANEEIITNACVMKDHGQILQDCMAWLSSSEPMEWTIFDGTRPFLLYKTLWNTILTLDASSSGMVVVPTLDSHTLHRVAVTVNAALLRLDIPVRISQVYTPMSTTSAQPSPYGMIQLSVVEK